MEAYTDGMTAKRVMEAVRVGDMEKVEAMLRARPELANMGTEQESAGRCYTQSSAGPLG